MEEQVLKPFCGKTILVTGATGFVGNRLIEVLQGVEGLRIRAIARNFGRAVRLARFPVEIIKGDILIKESLSKAFENVDYVFHCAYGNQGGAKVRAAVDQEGTLNLLEEANRNNVKGFVFLSTIAVYGLHKTGIISELTASTQLTDAYARSKFEAENSVLEFGRQKGLPVVVLQPTAIYGPWAESYGLRMLKMLQQGLMPLSSSTTGIANIVYVDDVIQAMLKSVVSSVAFGKRYIISGPEPVSWEFFFNAFEPVIGRPITVKLPDEQICKRYRSSLKKPSFISTVFGLIQINRTEAKKLLQYPLLKPLIVWAYNRIPKKMLASQKKKDVTAKYTLEEPGEAPVLHLAPDTLAFYTTTSQVSISAASQDFAYSPRFSFNEGFSRQLRWHRWFNGETEPCKSYD